MGFDNVVIMVPFCHRLEEAEKVLEILLQQRLERGKNNLEIYIATSAPLRKPKARKCQLAALAKIRCHQSKCCRPDEVSLGSASKYKPG